MDIPGLSTLLSVLGNAGASVLLVGSWAVFVLALYRKKLVFGWQYERLERQVADQDVTIGALTDVIAHGMRGGDGGAPRPPQRRGTSGTSGFDRRARR